MENIHKQQKIYFLILLLLAAPGRLLSQELSGQIISYFNIINAIPQEKLYIHLDKPFYGAGESIWFKAYLRNAITHTDETFSNFIITELIDRNDSVIIRKKIRRDSIGFHNSFQLPAYLPQGDYYLRGYSNWMLNEDIDFLYTHPIRIGNSIDVSILSDIEYQQQDEHTYVGKIKFTNQENQPFENIKIKYTIQEDTKTIDSGTLTTNSDGVINVVLPSLLNKRDKTTLEVVFRHKELDYKRRFFLPQLSTDFDLTFFPEGGDLLNLPIQRIAFKVQKTNGFSGSVKGKIVDTNGDSITSVTTQHDGMGIFSIRPISGQHYFAEVTSEEGISKRFELPEVKDKGFSLSILQRKKEIIYQVHKTEITPWPQSLYLVGHTRGKMCILKEIMPTGTTGKINEEFMDEGITHFLLVNGDGTPVSERLCFVRHTNETNWEIISDKNEYDKREKVCLQIKATDQEGIPVTGNFSVSITDASTVIQDSLSNNILSNLLLTSDLKGYIENPGYYFLSNDPKTRNDLDLVMMTHGWRRFHINNLKENPVIHKEHFIEQGQFISGSVKGFFGGKVRQGTIMALAPQLNLIKAVTTNEKGEFLIDELYFPDSTQFIIQARTKRGFAGVDIVIDSTYYPAPTGYRYFSGEPVPFMDDYLVNTREKYYYEGGMRVYNMKEVVVTARRERPKNLHGAMAEHIITSEEIEKSGQSSIYNLLMRFPGIQIINGNQIRIRNNQVPPAIQIDNVLYEQDEHILEAIPIHDIATIEVIKGAGTSIYGMRGAGGVIAIQLKDGSDLNLHAKPSRGITIYSPLGYSEAIEFYNPTYETPEKKRNSIPDLRTTLYWSPSLLFNSDGTATIEYYTSDNSTSQHIVIEGVDARGIIHRYSDPVNSD